MQNAQSGQASLINNSGIMKTIILGIDKNSTFNGKDVSIHVPISQNTDIQGIVLSDESHRKGDINISSEVILADEDVKAEENLNRISIELESEGVHLDVPKKHILDKETLIENSLLYDLFCSGNELLSESNGSYNNILLKLKCPVLLFPAKVPKVNHILLLFDGTSSSMTVIKQALAIFDDKIKASSVSVLALHNHNEKQYYREHLIVNFLLSKFPDVGVLGIQKDNLNKEMMRILKNNEGTLVFTGHYGAEIILKSELKNLILTFNNPFFFTY